MKKNIMEGRNCLLAEMQLKYLPIHTSFLNDPEVNRFILSRPPFTVHQQYKWLQERKKAGDQILAILVREQIKNSKHLVFIGVMDLRDIDTKKQVAYSGSVIGNKRYWQRGIAREARLMQLKIAFDQLGLKYVYSKTIRQNVRSQRLLESTGYRLIKIFRKARCVEGVLCDEFLYRVSRTLWLPHWNQYRKPK